jgi:hypothetical protein
MKENENREEILEDQLHQQYAENDNHRIGVFITFIVGIISLFGFYGYVFVYTNSSKHPEFNIEVFLLISFFTTGILFFLAILATYLGFSVRRDHFIVYNIRKKRYKNETVFKEIFGVIYDPSGKDFFSFLPDLYNLFYWLFFSSEIFIYITNFIKINDIKNNENQLCNNIIILHIILFHFIFIMLTIIFRKIYFNKYERLEFQERK